MSAKKGAIELSMNFLVVLIISIVIFGFGIRFVYNLSKGANDIREMSVEELDKRISDMTCESSDKVCVPVERKTIRRGNFDVFAIKILNVAVNNDQNFIVQASPASPLGYRKDRSPISASKIIINPASRVVQIERNDEQKVAVGIEVPDDAESGTYIFDVKIRQSLSSTDYVPVQKLKVDVP